MARTLQAAALPRIEARQVPAAATLTALGIVYGDIGTSPLYGFKQAADAAGAITPETRSRPRDRASGVGARFCSSQVKLTVPLTALQRRVRRDNDRRSANGDSRRHPSAPPAIRPDARRVLCARRPYAGDLQPD
jgi:hypothetical protein